MVNQVADRTFVVQVHRAEQLQEISTFSFSSSPTPYVRLSFLPDKETECSCEPLEDGGLSPLWDGFTDNVLAMRADKTTTGLLVEVWNENLTTDDLVGQTTIPLGKQRLFNTPQKFFYDLEPQGRVELTIHAMLAVTDSNVALGMRVGRGPDWNHGSQDGGIGGGGTVKGFLTAGTLCPLTIPHTSDDMNMNVHSACFFFSL